MSLSILVSELLKLASENEVDSLSDFPEVRDWPPVGEIFQTTSLACSACPSNNGPDVKRHYRKSKAR